MKIHDLALIAAICLGALTRSALAVTPQRFNSSADPKALGVDSPAAAQIDTVLQSWWTRTS